MTASDDLAIPCLPFVCPTGPSAPCRQGSGLVWLLLFRCVLQARCPGPRAAHVMVTQSLSGGERGQRGTWGPDCRPPVPTARSLQPFSPFISETACEMEPGVIKSPGSSFTKPLCNTVLGSLGAAVGDSCDPGLHCRAGCD